MTPTNYFILIFDHFVAAYNALQVLAGLRWFSRSSSLTITINPSKTNTAKQLKTGEREKKCNCYMLQAGLKPVSLLSIMTQCANYHVH